MPRAICARHSHAAGFGIPSDGSENRDGVDLNKSALRNHIVAEGDSCRLHGADERLRINGVDLFEVLDVLQVDGGAAHMFDAGSGGVENVLDVLQGLCRLLARGVTRQFASGRIDAQLTGDEYESIGLDRLAVCSQGGRRFGSRHRFHLLAHIFSPLNPHRCAANASGLDGDRTHDLLFRRQTLYPLSYKPVRHPTLHALFRNMRNREQIPLKKPVIRPKNITFSPFSKNVDITLGLWESI